MQPFAVTVEGDSSEISDKLREGLGNVFGGDAADDDSEQVAQELAAAAVELAGSACLGDGVERYTVSVTGTQTPGAGWTGLDSVHLHIAAAARQITDPASSGAPAEQV